MKAVHQHLSNKYGKDINNKISIYIINNLINNKKSKIRFKIKENEYYNFLNDYISNYFKIEDSKEILNNFSILHKEYFTYYLKPIFVEYYYNKIIMKAAELKAQILYDNKYQIKYKNQKELNNYYSPKIFFSNSIKYFLNDKNKNNSIDSFENISEIDTKSNESIETFLSIDSFANNSFLKSLNNNGNNKNKQRSIRNETYIIKLTNTKKTLTNSNNIFFFKNIKTVYNEIKSRAKSKKVVKLIKLNEEKPKNKIKEFKKDSDAFCPKKIIQSIEIKTNSTIGNKNDIKYNSIKKYKVIKKVNNFTVSFSEKKKRIIKINGKNDFHLKLLRNNNMKFPKIQHKLFNTETTLSKISDIRIKNKNWTLDRLKKINLNSDNSRKLSNRRKAFENIYI